MASLNCPGISWLEAYARRNLICVHHIRAHVLEIHFDSVFWRLQLWFLIPSSVSPTGMKLGSNLLLLPHAVPEWCGLRPPYRIYHSPAFTWDHLPTGSLCTKYSSHFLFGKQYGHSPASNTFSNFSFLRTTGNEFILGPLLSSPHPQLPWECLSSTATSHSASLS